MKAFGIEGAKASRESDGNGNQPSLEFQAWGGRQVVKHIWHLQLPEQQKGEQGFADVHLKAKHSIFFLNV